MSGFNDGTGWCLTCEEPVIFNEREKKKKHAKLKDTRRYRSGSDFARPPSSYASESQVTKAVIGLLKEKGWVCRKTHGNQYQKGFPDWYCSHPMHGPRWIEMKSQRPNHWLELSQIKWMREFGRAGTDSWVMTGVGDYPLLFKKGNWKQYIDPRLR